MKVLIVGEGRHELGDNAGGGALVTLVKRLYSGDFDYVVERAANKSIHAHHGKGPRFFKRAVRWLLEAQDKGFDALVFLIDQDGDDDRMPQLDRAQQWDDSQMSRAFGVAVQTFDAWMLADEQALSKALNCTVQRQPDPETIRSAKDVFRRLRDNSGSSDGLSILYARIARTVDPAILEHRCPRGFGGFAARVRAL